MKKKLLIAWLAVAAALCPTGAWAQALHVSMKDGKVFTFQFSESPKINYSGTAFAVVGDASEISGQMSQARAGANGQCSISLASLQPGIYVVRAGNASLKLSLNK